MRVYVSGPITGYENGNREAFVERVRLLTEAGYEAVNPHDCSPDHPGECTGRSIDRPHRYGCYLRGDLRVLLDCDAITFLPGWEASPGVRVERTVALGIGLHVVSLVEDKFIIS